MSIKIWTIKYRKIKLPIFAAGTEHCSAATTASVALSTLWNGQIATQHTAGLAYNCTVACVITPNVPFEPTNSFVKL